MIEVVTCTDGVEWDENVLEGAGHPLQLWGWGDIKSRGNWRVERLIVKQDSVAIGWCQVLYRTLPRPFKAMAYAPRGPVVAEEKREAVLEALVGQVRKSGAVSLTIEPDWEGDLSIDGWVKSKSPILMARTLVLDLQRTEEELLAHMTKKTRQYIRKSEKAGIEIKPAKNLADVAACLAIYKETAKRAGFALHKDDYYEDIFTTLADHSQLLMALHEGRVVAFLWMAVSEETAFELYGGMNDEGQELRVNYFLKWSAILRAKEWGIRRYDMNGLLNDGVSKFKQGFADHETMLVGAYEKPLSPFYPLWAQGLPAARKVIRLLKK